MRSDPQPRVLCVDDDEDAREMLSGLLKFSFIETRAVGTAAQALSLIPTEHFDLYLLDAWLPDLDGVELCRRLRALDRHTPILFYSGAAYDDDKKRAIEAGANAYVTKPDIDGLLGRVTELVFSGQVRRRLDNQCGPIVNVPWTTRSISSAESDDGLI